MPMLETLEFDSLTREVQKLADLGHGDWRVPEINHALLAKAHLVAADLARMPERARVHPDAFWEALDSAISAAITMLPPDESMAALEHFGFTNRVGADDRGDLTERKTSAATKLDGGRSLRWYTSPRAYSLGLAPQDYVLQLVTAALAGFDDPAGWVRAHAPRAHAEHKERRIIGASHYQGTLTEAMVYSTDLERSEWDFAPRARLPNESLASYQQRFHLRACLDGPAFLHPREYFGPTGQIWRPDDSGETGISDLVRRHIAVTCRERNPHVRIIVLCDPDYYWTVGYRIPRGGHDAFFSECLGNLDDLFGPGLTRGPDIAVRPKRKVRRPLFITPDIALKRIMGDWMPAMHTATDPNNWHAEYKASFDEEFNAAYQEQEAAYLALHTFLTEARQRRLS